LAWWFWPQEQGGIAPDLADDLNLAGQQRLEQAAAHVPVNGVTI